jgi:hypothetical protein
LNTVSLFHTARAWLANSVLSAALAVALAAAPATAVLFAASVTMHRAQAAATPSFELKNQRWEQLVIPANASALTVRELFADDLPAQRYSVDWVLFRFDGPTQQYVNPGLDGRVQQGVGFWMIQLTGSDVNIDLPALPNATVEHSAACPSAGGCTVTSLASRSALSSYNMLGSALTASQSVNQLRLRTPQNGSDCFAGCNLTQAADAGHTARELWRYNSSSGSYEDLNTIGIIQAWQGAWLQTKPGLQGSTTSLLFPDSSAPVGNGACMPAPALPPLSVSDPGKTVVQISSEIQLQSALSNLSDNTVLHLAPGTYALSNTLWVNRNNITIRGDSNRCDEIILLGKGMENASGANTVPHGIWTASNNLKVQNLTIRDVYYHPVSVNGTGQAPEIYNVRMLDAGEQFIKINPVSFSNGSDNGRVEYSVMKYTAAPPVSNHGGGTGYTNGVDVHAGSNWLIRHNRFENFHTPDSAQNLFNPAVLMWNGASNSMVENNVFIDVDRAIAFGLQNRANDHSGGMIRNNMIVMRENLYSAQRRANSDAAIVIWSSPNTQVLHNTVVTQGNTNKSIELRFSSNGADIRNNLTDAPIADRSNNQFTEANNVLRTDASIYRNTADGDLHLTSAVIGVVNNAPVLPAVRVDIDGDSRDDDQTSDAGADEYR